MTVIHLGEPSSSHGLFTLLCSLQQGQGCPLSPRIGAVLFHPNSVFTRTICPVHPVCRPIVAASPVWEPLSHRRSGLPFFLCPCLVIPDKIRVEMITFVVP